MQTTTWSLPEGRVTAHLPDDLVAGETVSGGLYLEPSGRTDRERSRNRERLEGHRVELAGRSAPLTERRARWEVPPDISELTLQLLDGGGRTVATSRVPVHLTVPRLEPPCGTGGPRETITGQVPATPTEAFTVPSLGQAGRILPIRGPFDGDFSTSSVRIGGHEAYFWAESPRRLLVQAPTEVEGATTLELEAGDLAVATEFRSLGVHLSAPRLDLRRGETTTLTVRITGAAELDGPVEMSLANDTPATVAVEGGDRQMFEIFPEAVAADGSYTLTRTVTGVRTGTFSITVVVRSCCQLTFYWQHQAMDIDVWPQATLRRLPDDPLPLKAFAWNRHCLVHVCCCLDELAPKPLELRADVRYEWELLAGPSEGFIRLNDAAPSPQATGEQVLLAPPVLEEPDQPDTIRIRVRALHDDPTKPPYHGSVQALLTIVVVREVRELPDGRRTDHLFGDPGTVEDAFIYNFSVSKQPDMGAACPDEQPGECVPEIVWRPGSPIEGSIVERPDWVATGDYARLVAQAIDIDVLELVCTARGNLCRSQARAFLELRDLLEFQWSAEKGRFPRGNSGREVVWQAPSEPGPVKIEVRVRDIGGQYDDDDLVLETTVDVLRLGIDLVKTPPPWLPIGANGSLDERESRLYVCLGGKWQASHRRKIVRYKLQQTSREPGIAMNYPRPPANNTNPDLFFGVEANRADFLLRKDETVEANCVTRVLEPGDNPAHREHHLFALGRRPRYQANTTLRVEDYGAFGELVAMANYAVAIPARDSGEEPCGGQGCCEGANTARVPRDDNTNDIADSAAQDGGGAAGNEDNDAQPRGEGTAGDGLTRYQEYRGFVVFPQVVGWQAVGPGVAMPRLGRGHIRTGVDRKDLFVYNQNSLPIGRFPTASGLRVHQINDQELFHVCEHRIVLPAGFPSAGNRRPIEINFNRCRNERHTGPRARHDWGAQHGLRLVEDNTLAGLYGIAETAGAPAGVFSTPRWTFRVAVNRASCNATGVAGFLAETTGHELAHAVNVRHHGDGAVCSHVPGGRVVGGALQGPGGAAAEVRTTYPRRLQTSGRVNCMMRYGNDWGWCHSHANNSGFYIDLNDNRRQDPGEPWVFLDHVHGHALPEAVATAFCSDATGDGANRTPAAGGAALEPAGTPDCGTDNPATLGNCLGQFRVKDW